MKVFSAQFVAESNALIPHLTRLENFDLHYGEDCSKKMKIDAVFKDAGIQVIPSLYANAASGGLIDKNAFQYIEQRILNDLKQHLHEIDGILLHLHGASEVIGLEGGSGDHHILKMIRKLVGPYLPIAIVCDPHGNLSKKYVERSTIIRCYRESPHTDMVQTIQLVSNMLIDLLHNRRNISPVYRKLSLILGGEQSVSTDEPVKSINAYMNELETDPRILSCSWHVGYIRHDCDVAGCGVVVIPMMEKDQEYATEVADELAQYVWEKRHEFHYTGLSVQPEDALKMALEYEEKPVFITDSGDNVTSGAMGCNTLIMRQVFELHEYYNKKILIAGIGDSETTKKLWNCELEEETTVALGIDSDDFTKSVKMDVKIIAKGHMKGCLSYGFNSDNYGDMITVSVKDKPIDVIICSNGSHPFVEQHQYQAAGIDWDDYDIIVVKLGYAFPELKEKGKLCIMSLTQGATYQDTKALPFKRIMRPMFPIDDI